MAELILSPFSNSDVRDWPAERYAELVGMLVEGMRWTGLVRVIGTAGQRLRAAGIVRDHDPARVVNDCGRLTLDAALRVVRGAACLIGNNSGMAHVAAAAGVPTVCVFGGSHNRSEWRPLGARVSVVSRAIGCSPCQLDHGATCAYDKACLRLIDAASVAEATRRLLAVDLPGGTGGRG